MEWVILTTTLPTNYDVYRQVVKAYPQRTPLELTLGVIIQYRKLNLSASSNPLVT
jgi:hypothetical protein